VIIADPQDLEIFLNFLSFPPTTSAIGVHSPDMQSDPAMSNGRDRDELASTAGPAPGQILTGKQEHCKIDLPSCWVFVICTITLQSDRID